MKTCPGCREEYDDDMSFCMFDGRALSYARASARASSKPSGPKTARTQRAFAREQPRASAGRSALALLLFALVAAGAGAAAFYYMAHRASEPVKAPLAQAQAAAPAEASASLAASAPSPAEAKISIAELPREDLMQMLPKNLLRRFRAGEAAQGTPDDLRVISSHAGEFVAMVGVGKFEGPDRVPTGRILLLKYEEQQFRDVTKQLLPRRYGDGTVAGQRAEVAFDDASANLIIREPASSSAVVDECQRCEHAYQQVTLEWKGDRYVESFRSWENDRYTAFYVLADALEKRRVDQAARPFIDKSLDHIIAKGFARAAGRGWAVEWRSDDDEADTADYELNNGADHMIVTVSKVKDRWVAVDINEQR